MLNLLLRIKSFIPSLSIFLAIMGLIYGMYWHGQYVKSQHVLSQQIQQMATLKASQELLQSAVTKWKEEAESYNNKLKIKEVIIAKQSIASKERIKHIFKDKYSDDCTEAIHQGIVRYSKIAYPTFNWNNNTP